MKDLAAKIKTLFPQADFVDRIVLRDDGQGPYVHQWDDTLGPQPTVAQLAATQPTLPRSRAAIQSSVVGLLPSDRDKLLAKLLAERIAADPVWATEEGVDVPGEST